MKLLKRLSNAFSALFSSDPVTSRRVIGPEYGFDQTIATSQEFDPEDIISYLEMADSGDSEYLYTLFDEMIARDAHLASEIDKARLALTSSPVIVQPWPPSNDKSRTDTAHEVAGWLETVIDSPDVQLDKAIATLFKGQLVGIGGFEYTTRLLPDGSETIKAIYPVPSYRFKYDPITLEPLVRVTASDSVPASSIPSLVYIQADEAVPAISRRGVLRSLLAAWLTRVYGLSWWSQAVEQWGVPYRIGRHPAGDEETRKLLIDAFTNAGNAPWIVAPQKAVIDFMQEGAAVLSNPPHMPLMDFCASEMSKRIIGATQITQVAANAGSFASAGVHMDVFKAITFARAKSICYELRKKLFVPLVSRRFGPEIAEQYTPNVLLDTSGKPDPTAFASMISVLVNSGDEEIPISWAHEQLSIPPVKDGEKCFKQKAQGKAQTSPTKGRLTKADVQTTDGEKEQLQ